MSVSTGEMERAAVQLVAWCVAIAWCVRTWQIARFTPQIPDLRESGWDIAPSEAPTLTVVVPARDEATNIAETLDSLVASDWHHLHVVAVDDRSSDGTGAIVDAYAGRFRHILDALHIVDLPEGWLGKTHALFVATERSQSEYLLFTDADVVFSSSILRRALAYAKASQADHLVVLPTMQVKSVGEGALLGFFQSFGAWATRLWRVSDSGSRRDVIGVGAFNLVRRGALEAIGGWAPQRLAILEDVTLGRRMKAAGLRQRVAFAPGAVQVHWAKGVKGLMGVMTKNMFSAFNFRPFLVLLTCVWMTVFYLAPLAELIWRPTLLPGVIVLACLAVVYRVMGKISEIDARYVCLYPLGVFAFMGTMLRSMTAVLWRGGVVWRGTHYDLRELRHHNSPFLWGSQK